MQVTENLERNSARCSFSGLGEHQLAQLCEKRHGKAKHSVGKQQADRDNHQSLLDIGLRSYGIDQDLEQNRHADIRHLGSDHEGERSEHSPLVLPQIRKEATKCLPIGALGSLGHEISRKNYRRFTCVNASHAAPELLLLNCAHL
ncbi:hypothetical protein GGD71_000007 [Variovorax guangxiensis]|uniref:Uncharacterized protein n=1 Tax=Variovorax guangxiensis TaxID=1775474 RepID=A0A840FJ83_9BURK|nr:hypothetical protein [Variovorax guangxiensis]